MTMIEIPDLGAKWRLLRGNASFLGKNEQGKTVKTIIETQVQFARALRWDKSELNRSLKSHADEVKVPWLAPDCVPAFLRLFQLDPVAMAKGGVDLFALVAEPLPVFCRHVRENGGTDYQLTSWDRFVTEHGEAVSDARDQGRGRLFLHTWLPGSSSTGDSLDRLLAEGEADPATGDAAELPQAHVDDKACIELHAAWGIPETRDLRRKPVHVLLFQDVKINGQRQFRRMATLSPLVSRDRLMLPNGVEMSPSKAFNVPDERWGALRKLVAVITDTPIGKDILGDGTTPEIDPANLDLLADRLLQAPNVAAAHAGRGSHAAGFYGRFCVWEFEYAVTRRASAANESG